MNCGECRFELATPPVSCDTGGGAYLPPVSCDTGGARTDQCKTRHENTAQTRRHGDSTEPHGTPRNSTESHGTHTHTKTSKNKQTQKQTDKQKKQTHKGSFVYYQVSHRFTCHGVVVCSIWTCTAHASRSCASEKKSMVARASTSVLPPMPPGQIAGPSGRPGKTGDKTHDNNLFQGAPWVCSPV